MMTPLHMTPVLSGLLLSRETEPKTSALMIRSAPTHVALTSKARELLAGPVVLEVFCGKGWVELDTARNLDAATEKVKGCGAGRFVQRGRVVAYWDERKRA